MAGGSHSYVAVGVSMGGCGSVLRRREMGPPQCGEGSISGRVSLDHDDWTVEECGIGAGSTIEVVARERGRFTVFIMAFNLQPFRLMVTKSERVIEVKGRINSRIGLDPNEYDLVHDGAALKDEESVEESNVVKGSVIAVDVSFGTIRVTAEPVTGRRIECVVRTSDTMVVMKRKIYKKMGVSPILYRLLHEGRVIECGDKTVINGAIGEGSVISAVRINRDRRVFVKTETGETYGLEVDTGGHTVRDLWRMIYEEAGISREGHKLVYGGVILGDDERTLYKYGVTGDSVVSVEERLRGGMMVHAVKGGGRKHTLEVLGDERVLDMKMKVCAMLGVQVETHKLEYQGRELRRGSMTVEGCGIVEGSVVNVVYLLGYGMQIFARTMDGKCTAFEVFKCDRIIDVKEKIQEKIGLSLDEQKLLYQGGILEDDKAVDEYQIADKSVINIVARLRGGPQIFAKTMDGKTVALEVAMGERIIDVKKKIQEKIGLSPDEQKLVYQGGILKDDKTLKECLIEEMSVINVVTRLKGSIRMIVRTMDGRTVTLEVAKSDRIIDVKKRVQEKIGVRLAVPVLVYQGGVLDDDTTVALCGIEEDRATDIFFVDNKVMSICVQSMNGRQMIMEVRNTDRVVGVKMRVWMKLGITGSTHVMNIGGRVMKDDHQRLFNYGITDGSVIWVSPISRMVVNVKDENGEVEGVEVLSCDSIREVKEKVEEKFGLPVDQHVLYLQARRV